MTSSSAYLLVSHGSRDPKNQIARKRLTNLVRQQLEMRVSPPKSTVPHKLDWQFKSPAFSATTAMLSKPNLPLVGTACLELAPLPLHKTIQQFALKMREVGLKRLQILPLFLLPGVHVKQDIPTEVALAQQVLEQEIVIEIGSHLGNYVKMKNLLFRQFDKFSPEGRILLSHGSRLVGSNQSIEAIASELEALVAYWSLSPSLTEQVETLVAEDKQKIAIQPYFLFSGTITEAISKQVQQLQLIFPQVELLLGKPLEANRELVNLIIEGIEE